MSLFIATTPPCGGAWLSSIASSRGFDSILSALMCFTAMLAACEKISPSSAFGPLIGRLAPTLMVFWAIAPLTQMSEAAMAAVILDFSMKVLPCVARLKSARRDICGLAGLRSDELKRLSTGLADNQNEAITTAVCIVGRGPMSLAQHAPRSEEHTSELQSRGLISYAVFCL